MIPTRSFSLNLSGLRAKCPRRTKCPGRSAQHQGADVSHCDDAVDIPIAVLGEPPDRHLLPIVVGGVKVRQVNMVV